MALPRTAAMFVAAAALRCSTPSPAPGTMDAAVDATVAEVAPFCTPGAVECGADGLSPRTCDALGSAWTEGRRCDGPGGEVCDRGACVRACEGLARESRGCEFWPVQTLHPELGRFVDGANRDDFPFSVVVSNPWPSAVRVTLEGGGLAAPLERTVGPNTSLVLETPWQPALVDGVDHLHRQSAVFAHAALHLRTSAPVSAYQFNPLKTIREPECDLGDRCYSFSSDASLLLPATALGREHVVAAMPTQRALGPGSTEWSVGAGFVSVVGTVAGTQVTVRLAGDVSAGEGIAAGGMGTARTFTLGAGDVLQLLSPTSGECPADAYDRITQTRFCLPIAREDLTGTVVTATQPVAVFSGHECAFVPYDRYACDHLEEQVPPVDTLGTRYVVSRVAPVPEGLRDHPEGEPTAATVIAAHDGTDVTFDPPSVHAPVRLDRGQSVPLLSALDYQVTASQPVLVAVFEVGGDYFRQEVAVTANSYGDPELSYETPVDQYRARYDFYVPPDYESFVNVVIARGETLRLDDALVTAAPAATLGARDIYRLRVAAGAHHIAGTNPGSRFGLRVYGFAPYTSYMYPGGMDLVSIAPPL